MTGETPTSSQPPRTNGPRPYDPIAVRIVTLLDFAGPLQPGRIAAEFGLDIDDVRGRLASLIRTGHVRFSEAEWGAYQTSGLFDPDLDSSGHAMGPHTPKRLFADDRLVP